MRHLAELVPGEAEHGVAGLVVELVGPGGVLRGPRDAVVLGHTDAAAEEVPRGGARVHGELAGVDDGETAVGRELRALGEAFLAVDTVGEVVGFFWEHGQLGGEGPVTEEESRRLGAPGLEVVLGVLDEDVCMKYVSKRVC